MIVWPFAERPNPPSSSWFEGLGILAPDVVAVDALAPASSSLRATLRVVYPGRSDGPVFACNAECWEARSSLYEVQPR